jgi:import receptor subunit TOM22
MVKLTEVEDEHYSEKPMGLDGEVLLEDDDDNYTDTGNLSSSSPITPSSNVSPTDSEISDMSEPTLSPLLDESLTDRLLALRDMIPPKTRARISSATNTIVSASSTGISYTGKGLWVLATSVLLLGLPYMLAVGQEQELMEEERQRTMMMEGASGIMQPEGEAKAAL